MVSGLHTLSAHLLGDPEHDMDEDVLVAGDSKDAKRRVAEIVGRIPGCGRWTAAASRRPA